MTDASAVPPSGFSLPESLLTVQSVEDAVTICSVCGLRPILLHAPTVEGGCTCGRAHDKTLSGSSSTGKHPIQSNWQKRELSLDELLNQIANLRFTPNVGMVLGKQRDGEFIVAVDVDDAERFAELEAELGPLPETPRCDSGRGYRLFYTLPPEIDVGRLKNVTGLGSEPGSPRPGVDVKAEGGQVVIAPSLHANGKRYVWTVVGEIAVLPAQWALQLLKKPETPKSIQKYTPTEMNKPGRARNSGERYLTVAVNGEAYALAACGQGLRNNTLYSSACRMFEYCGGMHLSHKWQWVHDELLSAAKASGLPDHESRATLASAERRVRESGKVRSPMVLEGGAPSVRPSQEPPEGAGDAWEPETLPSVPTGGVEPQSTKRPVIQLSTELLVNANAAIDALKTDDHVYQRAGMLVHVTRVTREEVENSRGEEEEGRRQMPIEGSPQIRNLSRAVIKARLSHVAVFKKWVNSSQDYKAVLPPDDVVGHIHDVSEYPGIRLLTSVVETPTFRADGTVMQVPGHDPMTGYLYIPGCSFPPVDDSKATQQNAEWALGFLKEVFADFPYVNESHRMVPIAAILTLIARPAILGSVPAILFDASTRGSGKTLQTDAIAMVATGRGAARMNYSSDDVELEKILGSYALKGSPFICLDNVPTMRPFGGGPIDRCITARDTVEIRVLGKSETPELRWRALIMATGNNMTLFADTARRALMARLEPKEENPEHRTKFLHKNLLDYIGVQRPRLVAAALLILRAYWRAGKPNMGCKPWGSFEEWASLIPHAIVFAGGADPMLARPERDEDVDPETQALSCILEMLPVLHSQMQLDHPDQASDLGLPGRVIVWALYDRIPQLPNLSSLRDALDLLCKPRNGRGPSRPDPTALGYKFRSLRARIVGGRKLTAKNGDAHTTYWKVERTDGEPINNYANLVKQPDPVDRFGFPFRLE
jgi:hypothetical protein